MSYKDNYADFIALLRNFDPTQVGFQFDRVYNRFEKGKLRMEMDEDSIAFFIERTHVGSVSRDDLAGLRKWLIKWDIIPATHFYLDMERDGLNP